MPLPFFLQPLLLVAYYQEQLAQYIARWFQRSNEQLFGPLEQLVAAVVILGLAMQAPPLPLFWSPPTPPPIILNSTGLPPSLGTGSSSSTSLEKPSLSTGNALLDRVYTRLPEWLQISPVNIALLLMVANVGMLMMGHDLRRRLRESWDLFWPPWQDRHRSSLAGTQVRFADPESSSRDMGKKTESEKARNLKAIATQSVEPLTSVPKARTEGVDNMSKDTKDGEKEKLTESEKAQRAKEANSNMIDDRGGASADVKDKGKARMDGERPTDSNPPSPLKNPENTDKPATKSDRDSKSRSIALSDAKKATTSDEDEPPSNGTSSRSTSGSGTDDDDPLMSGDYRPLKSSLKKSKKKPRQSKNIHHNYFMTMRGYRPALVPFPHGFHPKPHEPMNTLWWDNVPRNAEHIMATPKVPKEPEDKDEDDKKEKETEKGKGKDEGEKANREKEREKSKSSDEKKGGSSVDKEKEKERERAKAKAEAEAKTAKEAELKARAKAADTSQPEKPVVVPVDTKIQKATYLSQGLLSILLYYLNPQLGFLLLTFFVWQYINSHNELVLSLRSSNTPSSSSASSLQPSASRGSSQANDETSRQTPGGDPAKSSSAQPSNAEKIADLDILITKLKSLPELTPEHKDKLERAMTRRKQLIEEDAAKRKPTTGSSATSQGEKKDGDGSKISIEELERKAKEMDDYVIKARAIENPSEEQKSKLTKAEERRKELWKQVRVAKGNDPTSMMPSTSTREKDSKLDEKPEVMELEKKARQLDEYVLKARSIEHPSEEQSARLVKAEERRKVLWREVRVSKGNEPASMMPRSAKSEEDELKVRIKELELYIMKYNKVEDPSDEIKEKLNRAESRRRALKKELVTLMENSGVGSSGLSVDEKESLANSKE